MEPKEEAEIRVKMDKEKEREGCSSFSLSVLFSVFYLNPKPEPMKAGSMNLKRIGQWNWIGWEQRGQD